jgi:hypothetical protein
VIAPDVSKNDPTAASIDKQQTGRSLDFNAIHKDHS